MACLNTKQKSKKKKSNSSFDTNDASAVIGCFLKCQKDARGLYAVVCKHVTHHSNGNFYVGDPSLNEQIARKMNSEEHDVESFNNDVDIVEIIESARQHVRTVYLNDSGKKGKYRLYRGSIENLFGETVFQCYRPREKTDSDFESKSGKVVPISQIDGITTDVIPVKSHFVVRGLNGEPFALEGDSGRIVAREADGYVELVGVITGDFNSRTAPQSREHYSVCMLLTSAVEHLNLKYNMQLTLFDTDDCNCRGDKDIEPGQIVRFPIRQKRVSGDE